MNPLHNIFSNKKEIIKPMTKIAVDIREKNSLVYSNLVSKGANANFENLEIGDYLIQDTIIERKTFSDFISSIIDKRLFIQLNNMARYEKRILILEGFDHNYSKYGIHENAIKGAILSVISDFKTPIIYTNDEKDTASFLIILSKRVPKLFEDYSLRLKKETKSLYEQKRFILEGFPGIGPQTAKSLLNQFNNLKSIFNSSKKKLQKITDLNENKIDSFQKILND